MSLPDGSLRRIWLCADDYGIAPGVNTAIRNLIAMRRLNATSVMTVAPACNAADVAALKALKADNPDLAIGLHVTLTAPFKPLTSGYAPLRGDAFRPVGQTLIAGMLRLLDTMRIEREIRAQVSAFADRFGAAPDYLDGHQHVQIFPQVRDAILNVAREDLPGAWVRQCQQRTPSGQRLSDPKGLLLDRLSSRFRRRAAQRQVRTNPAFAGTYSFNAKADFTTLFPQFLDGLPAGSVVMCHPGFVDDTLRRLDPLTDLREREYAYFAADGFPKILSVHGVTLSHQ